MEFATAVGITPFLGEPENHISLDKFTEIVETITDKKFRDSTFLIKNEMCEEALSLYDHPLTPEQKEKMKQERKAMIDSLTPQEREHMREQRKKMFENMSPEERKKWREEMHKSMREFHQNQG